MEFTLKYNHKRKLKLQARVGGSALLVVLNGLPMTLQIVIVVLNGVLQSTILKPLESSLPAAINALPSLSSSTCQPVSSLVLK